MSAVVKSYWATLAADRRFSLYLGSKLLHSVIQAPFNPFLPIFVAESLGRPQAFAAALRAAGANPAARDESGETPLMYAAGYNKNTEVVQALLDAGADATATNSGGETAWDLIQENEALKRSPAYRALNDLRFR